MNELDDIKATLRTAIAYSKRPGNEGQSLANSKGIYRPVSEVLTPALEALNDVDDLINAMIIHAHSGVNNPKNQVACMLALVNEFKTNLGPKLTAANAAKARVSK